MSLYLLDKTVLSKKVKVVVTMSITTFHFCCEMATVTKYHAINCLIPVLEMQQGMV